MKGEAASASVASTANEVSAAEGFGGAVRFAVAVSTSDCTVSERSERAGRRVTEGNEEAFGPDFASERVNEVNERAQQKVVD